MLPITTGPQARRRAGAFGDQFPAFTIWLAQVETWRDPFGDIWYFDGLDRAVGVSPTGVITIHPDHTGTTAWFADILTSPVEAETLTVGRAEQ